MQYNRYHAEFVSSVAAEPLIFSFLTSYSAAGSLPLLYAAVSHRPTIPPVLSLLSLLALKQFQVMT